MLRSAVMAPARRFAADSASRCGQGLRAPVRRKCQMSRPSRAGDGISHDIHYEGLWGAITTFPKRKPFATNCIIATIKTAAADVIVQGGEGKYPLTGDYDYRRTGVFTAFGFFYLGIVQWFVYVTVFTRLCPNAVRFSNLPWAEKLKDKAGQKDLAKQVALDNFGHYTFIYFPVFYCFKESIQGEGVDQAMVNRALNKYWNNVVADNLAIWGLWVPLDFIIYAAPVWLRLPLNHAVSFAWTMILSWMRGEEK